MFSSVRSNGIWQLLESPNTSLLWCDHWYISMWTQLLLRSLGPAALFDPYRRNIQWMPLKSMHVIDLAQTTSGVRLLNILWISISESVVIWNHATVYKKIFSQIALKCVDTNSFLVVFQSPGGSRSLLRCLCAGVLLLWVRREIPRLLHSCGCLRTGLQRAACVCELEDTWYVS